MNNFLALLPLDYEVVMGSNVKILGIELVLNYGLISDHVFLVSFMQ